MSVLKISWHGSSVFVDGLLPAQASLLHDLLDGFFPFYDPAKEPRHGR